MTHRLSWTGLLWHWRQPHNGPGVEEEFVATGVLEVDQKVIWYASNLTGGGGGIERRDGSLGSEENVNPGREGFARMERRSGSKAGEKDWRDSVT